MTAQPIPAALQALHAEILDCEARGQTYLAEALRKGLNRELSERGIEITRVLVDPVAQAKQAQTEAVAALATIKPISIRLLPPPQ